MIISKEQREILMKFLNERWKMPPCQMCGDAGWVVSDRVFELREFTQGALVIGGGSVIYPVIPINCPKCGHTLLLSAILAGIIEEPAPTSKQGGEK
jgi:hypothetical protein